MVDKWIVDKWLNGGYMGGKWIDMMGRWFVELQMVVSG